MRHGRRPTRDTMLVHDATGGACRIAATTARASRPRLHLPRMRTPATAHAAIAADMIKALFWRTTMPTYHIEMLEGRTVEQKRLLAEEITRVSVEILGGSPDSVDILITDVKRENWATGGKLWLDRQ